MSGTTGGAGGAAPGGAPYGGVPQPPTEHPAASTSLMSAVGSGGGYTPAPTQPPGTPAPGGSGYSQPTTYTKGQPTPPRGTRTGTGPAGAPQGGAAPRRPAPAPGAPAPAPAPGGMAARTRKARLRITKADPWSVMKVSFLLSLALGIIMIVAAAVLWGVLDSLGVFSSVGNMLKDATGSGTGGSSSGINIMDYVGFGKVLTYTSLIAVVDVILLTALCTLAAFIYNAAAGFTGGVELTLAEED